MNIASDARQFVQTIKNKTDVIEQYSTDQIIQAIFALNEIDESQQTVSQQIIDYLGNPTQKDLSDLNIKLDFTKLCSLKTDQLKAQYMSKCFDSYAQIPIRPLLVGAAQHTCQHAESLQDMLALGL